MIHLTDAEWRMLYIYAWGGYHILKEQFKEEMTDPRFEELLSTIQRELNIQTPELQRFLQHQVREENVS